jgi:rhodanese-related sulfurtransferase
MILMKIKSHKQLVEEASLEIENLTPEEAKTIFDDNTILIDIRDIRELWREGTVENSKHIPRGMLEFWLDPSSHYYKEEFAVEKKKILFCAQGMRSALAAKTLKDMGFTNVAHIKGGFEALKKSDFKVIEVKKK